MQRRITALECGHSDHGLSSILTTRWHNLHPTISQTFPPPSSLSFLSCQPPLLLTGGTHPDSHGVLGLFHHPLKENPSPDPVVFLNTPPLLPLSSATFWSDDPGLFITGDTQFVSVWDTETFSCVQRTKVDEVFKVAMSKCGGQELVAVACEKQVVLYDLVSGSATHRVEGGRDVCWSSTNPFWIATFGEGVRIYDVRKPGVLIEMNEMERLYVDGVKRRRVESTGLGLRCVWEAGWKMGRRKRRESVTGLEVGDRIRFSWDGMFVITGGSGGLKIWDVATGRFVRKIGGGGVFEVARDGCCVVRAMRGLELVEIESGDVMGRHIWQGGEIAEMEVDPIYEQVYTVTGGRITRWSGSNPQENEQFRKQPSSTNNGM